MAVPSDFIDIQLSPEGLLAAGPKGSLRITTQHLSYVFTPGSTVRVLSSEWNRLLSREQRNGQPLFALAAPAAAKAADAEAALNTLKAEEAAVEAQISQSSKSSAKGGK